MASPGCVLRIGGRELRIDTALDGLDLSPCKVWRVGESLSGTGKIYKDSGCNIVVSERSSLTDQIEDASLFFRAYRPAFEKLLQYSEIDYRALDFGVGARDVAVQVEEFPTPFIREASQFLLSLMISIYRM